MDVSGDTTIPNTSTTLDLGCHDACRGAPCRRSREAHAATSMGRHATIVATSSLHATTAVACAGGLVRPVMPTSL